MLKKDNISFFKEYQNLINKYDDQKKSFIVGEVFYNEHKLFDPHPQFFEESFQPIFDSSKEKVISIDYRKIGMLHHVHFPDVANGGAAQLFINSASAPMAEHDFWLLLYSLIIEPELGRVHFSYEVVKTEEAQYVPSYIKVRLDSGDVIIFSMSWAYNNLVYFGAIKNLSYRTDYPKSTILFFGPNAK